MPAVEFPLVDLKLHDINPLLTGHEACESGHRFGPFARDCHLIHYVTNGTGVFSHPTGNYTVKKGQIFLIHPGELTTYTADKNDPWTYIWVGFNGTVAERLRALPSPVLDYGANTFFELLEAANITDMREEFITAKIYEILYVLLGQREQKPHYVAQAKNFIRVNYMLPITAENVAATVGVSLRYLSRLFKASTGSGVQDYLIRTRLHHAKQLLAQGSTVSEAAFQSGFNDVSHFSKTFKKVTGLSPSNYGETSG